jgi:DNA primase
MDIQQIKQNLSILKVLAHYNLVPDRNNRLKCPFHEDTTPSFQVYPNTGTWNCFSSNCLAGSGDQIDKHDAIMKAKEMLSCTPPEAKPTDFVKLFEDFKYALQRSSKAKEYLNSRNLRVGVPPSGVEVGYNTGNKYDKPPLAVVCSRPLGEVSRPWRYKL